MRLVLRRLLRLVRCRQASRSTPYMVRRILFGGGVRAAARETRRSVQATEKYASDFARKCGTDVCLIVSRRMRVWFDKDGSLKEVIEEVPGGE